MKRQTMITRLRSVQHTSVRSICVSEQFRLALERWFIRDLSLVNTSKWIVSLTSFSTFCFDCNRWRQQFEVNFCLIFRRCSMYNDNDRFDASRTNGFINYANAVYLSQHNRFGYGTTQSDFTLWIDAYGCDESMRMAVRAGRRNETRNSSFPSRAYSGQVLCVLLHRMHYFCNENWKLFLFSFRRFSVSKNQLKLQSNGSHHFMTRRHSDIDDNNCSESTIMSTLVQNASPFLFPCTIEYSLICAVILFEMWKHIKSIPDIERQRRNSVKTAQRPSANHFSVDCSRAHRGLFAGIIIIVLTIICLIMYFVLRDEPDYEHTAISEVVFCEILMYVLTTFAVMAAVFTMRDLKFQRKTNDHSSSTVSLDCTLLVLAQTGVYSYGLFSIVGCFFAMIDNKDGGKAGFVAEVACLIQTSVQTLFILNSSWRRCKGAQQQRNKPGREMITFLLVANISLWFINTLIKSRAQFRPTHLSFYGIWAWTVITHVSMPLAIFYRFHSTICLFEIWKSAYKTKDHWHGTKQSVWRSKFWSWSWNENKKKKKTE